MKKTVEGFKVYRHASNPKEEELHDEFVSQMSTRDMDYIVFGHKNSPSGSTPDDYLSERERRIVVSTIQWLGSPVGQTFLRRLGYCEEEEFLPKERLFSEKIAHLEKRLAKIPNWLKLIFL